jgi:hypothetical protein
LLDLPDGVRMRWRTEVQVGFGWLIATFTHPNCPSNADVGESSTTSLVERCTRPGISDKGDLNFNCDLVRMDKLASCREQTRLSNEKFVSST